MDEFRPCPYCGEEIRTAATRCRFCRSRLTALDPERWYRDHPERRVAGVASAVARALAVPVGAVRLGFIVLTFLHFLGPPLYGALWLLVPFSPGGDAPLTGALARARNLLDQLLSSTAHKERRPDDPPTRRPARENGDDAPRTTTLPLQRLSS